MKNCTHQKIKEIKHPMQRWNKWMRKIPNTILSFTSNEKSKQTKKQFNCRVVLCSSIVDSFSFVFSREIKEISYRTDENGWKWEKKEEEGSAFPHLLLPLLLHKIWFLIFLFRRLRIGKEWEEKKTFICSISLKRR